MDMLREWVRVVEVIYKAHLMSFNQFGGKKKEGKRKEPTKRGNEEEEEEKKKEEGLWAVGQPVWLPSLSLSLSLLALGLRVRLTFDTWILHPLEGKDLNPWALNLPQD